MLLMPFKCIEKNGINRIMAEPIATYIIKIASRCNLDCDYCYEYNMGDESWKKEPATISEDVLNVAVDRIHNHAKIYNKS